MLGFCLKPTISVSMRIFSRFEVCNMRFLRWVVVEKSRIVLDIETFIEALFMWT